MRDQYWHYPQSVLISTDIIHDQCWSLLVLSTISVVHYWYYPWSVLIIADIIHDQYWSLTILSMIGVEHYWYYPWSMLIITDIIHDRCWSLLIFSVCEEGCVWEEGKGRKRDRRKKWKREKQREVVCSFTWIWNVLIIWEDNAQTWHSSPTATIFNPVQHHTSPAC